ncbi:hypothetical protein [Inquilinus limosus]|uniref:hypothetical protein n=1 Tax=Inquilinus limosus TaxID=171674 RepID=UPI00040CF15D|nr:hypothetical protein [Inquilinus limosus]
MWERLTEDEVLDVQLDTLSAGEFVREVCRWLGRRLDPSRLPPGWDDVAQANDNASGSPPDAGTDVTAVNSDTVDGWPAQPDESEDGLAPFTVPKPDSS